MKKVLFIGGPGNISASTALELLSKGWDLGLLTLPGSIDDDGILNRATLYYGDRNVPGSVSDAVKAFKPDVVIDYWCFAPKQAQETVDAIYERTGQYIFISTVDVYGYPLSNLPMRETDPFNPPNCEYAEDKKCCEDLLWLEHDKRKLPLTVVRPSYSMGNRFAITAMSREGGKYLVPRLRACREILIPGDGTTLLHAGAAWNTGRMIARMAGSDAAIGQSFTCAHEKISTYEDYIRLFADALGVAPRFAYIPVELMYASGAKGVQESILNDLTRHNVAFSVEKFKSYYPDFIWEKTLKQAIRDYIDFNDHHGLFADLSVDIVDDRIIQEWKRATSGFRVD